MVERSQKTLADLQMEHHQIQQQLLEVKLMNMNSGSLESKVKHAIDGVSGHHLHALKQACAAMDPSMGDV
eukprot:10933627-Karenia_brevis.AAC.1